MANSKKPTVIYKATTSKFIFLWPVAIFISMLFYSIFLDKGNHFFTIFIASLFPLIPAFLFYYGKRIILTPNKVYIYIKNKKFISWKIIGDFKHVEYSQSRLGKLFNFGTLLIVNQNNESYQYMYLNNVQQMYEHIIIRYEKLMKRLDPDFIPVYKQKEVKTEIDSLDTIEETNEE